jgi:hypothetical protein
MAMEKFIYIGGKDPDESGIVKRKLGYIFYEDTPVKIYDEGHIRFFHAYPELYKAVEMTDTDRLEEKSRQLSLVALKERMDALEAKLGEQLEEIKQSLQAIV